MSKYVQHKSGVGEKWKVEGEEEDVWYIKREPFNLWLPRSEYLEVPGPERWEDVTEFMHEDSMIPGNYEYRAHKHDWYSNVLGVDFGNGFRLRKVQLQLGGLPKWAFIIEKKVQP